MNQADHAPHPFHIPVLGTGFSIDTPLKVARYGISSVISLVDDVLIEQVREHHCRRAGEPFEPIADDAEDVRARRITAYLDLVDRLIGRQVEDLRRQPFTPASDLARYFRLLPEGPLRARHAEWTRTTDPAARQAIEGELRAAIVPGRADVNIMTSLDCTVYRQGQPLPPEFNDAMAALRGFARSTVRSAVVLSAGINPRLYGYLASLPEFQPDAEGRLSKQVILKVSDFRSADVQGRFLARQGVWVSEFRMESGLNCGGHAFPTQGHLAGPILDEFATRRDELTDTLRHLCRRAWKKAGRAEPAEWPRPRVTYQGGVGTAAEHNMLLRRYGLDGIGWGTLFMLVPEVVNVDPATLSALEAAGEGDVVLSDSSPLNVPYWNLMTCGSEKIRRQRVAEGHPGSPCPKRYLAFSTEFSNIPICTASAAYQRRKLAQLATQPLAPDERRSAQDAITGKSCICHDLGGSVSLVCGIDAAATPACCCGPNIAYFMSATTLDALVDHIYGRRDLPYRADRPHVFLKELDLYLAVLERMAQAAHRGGRDARPTAAIDAFRIHLLQGVGYYYSLAREGHLADPARFSRALEKAEQRLKAIRWAPVETANGTLDQPA